jgi:hypothetical protein
MLTVRLLIWQRPQENLTGIYDAAGSEGSGRVVFGVGQFSGC